MEKSRGFGKNFLFFTGTVVRIPHINVAGYNNNFYP